MFSKFTDTYFFTATINNWQHLLYSDNRKEIILSALKYLSQSGIIRLHAYVIMPNHIHLLLTLTEQTDFKRFQLSLLRYTAKSIIKELNERGDDSVLVPFKSTQADRQFQIWERRPKWIPIANYEIFKQKMEYIHLNPLQEKWQLANAPECYLWSSARFYLNGEISDVITYL